MQNCPDTFETRKRSHISAFSICMTVPLKWAVKEQRHYFQLVKRTQRQKTISA